MIVQVSMMICCWIIEIIIEKIIDNQWIICDTIIAF